jgi:hypothetical protein
MIMLPLLIELRLPSSNDDDNDECRTIDFGAALTQPLPNIIMMNHLSTLIIMDTPPVIFDALRCPQLQKLDTVPDDLIGDDENDVMKPLLKPFSFFASIADTLCECDINCSLILLPDQKEIKLPNMCFKSLTKLSISCFGLDTASIALFLSWTIRLTFLSITTSWHGRGICAIPATIKRLTLSHPFYIIGNPNASWHHTEDVSLLFTLFQRLTRAPLKHVELGEVMHARACRHLAVNIPNICNTFNWYAIWCLGYLEWRRRGRRRSRMKDGTSAIKTTSQNIFHLYLHQNQHHS